MMMFGSRSPRRTVRLTKRLFGWLIALLITTSLTAADPNVDPQVDEARAADPGIELPPPLVQWPAELQSLWLKALRHPEVDLQRQAADSIARAHQLGMPNLDGLVDDLINLLEDRQQHPVARTAAARAIVAVDARRAAPVLAEHARRGPIELSLVIEPALARWDFEPARAIWLERLKNSSTSPSQLQLALQCLGEVAEPRAIPEVKRLVMSEATRPTVRLAAAKSLAKLPDKRMNELARQLLEDSSPRKRVARLAGVHLLAHRSGDEALQLLDQYAQDLEPTVAAQAMQRLLQIAPARLVGRAASTITNSDARIRRLTVDALATAPSERSIRLLAPVLDDGVPEIREESRRVLLTMSGRDELRQAVIENAARLLENERWRGLEQSILILVELDQTQVGDRLMQLLQHPRAEVFVTAAWGLRKLAVPELAEPMFEEAKRFTAETDDWKGGSEMIAASAQLLEAMGLMNHRPAEPYLRSFVPKSLVHPEEVRTSAIWSLGHLWADSDSLDPELVGQLEERVADVGIPPESYAVRAMSVVTLGRMRAEASLPTLREWFSVEGPNSYLGACCGWAIEQITGETLPDPKPPTMELRGWFLEPVYDQ